LSRIALAAGVAALALAPPLALAAAEDPLVADEWWRPVVGADRASPPGPGLPLTIIDTGVDLTHPELASRPSTVALNEQVVGPGELHGTAVASVAAAPIDGVGLVGVYPQVILRVWDAGEDVRGLIAGLDAASQLGPGVISVSLGTADRPVVEQAVYAAVRRGSVVVASVGNERGEGSPEQFPASIPHVFTVGAVDEHLTVAPFSNASRALDLVAPGTNIRVAVPKAIDAVGYRTASGTSFAVPIVAGAAAWIWTQRPELDAGQVAELLRRSARDVGAPGFDFDTGWGLLDIPAALSAPAPRRDPSEPNDDIDLARGAGGFAGITPLLRPRGPRRGDLGGRVDGVEDPRDVYPVWVPARGSLYASVRADADVDLELWAPETVSVLEVGRARRLDQRARSAQRGLRPEVIEGDNTLARGRYFYVAVRPAPRTRRAAYTLTALTSPRP
jgi:subtilisin family serine protease